MKNTDIKDPLVLAAVEAIDTGNYHLLEQLLDNNQRLVRDRLSLPEKGYFQNPYLLWFVADNPIRIEKLPVNIVDITQLVIRFVKRDAMESMQYQLDYTLGLVATGRIPRECGVQLEMMDLLINEGAKPGGGMGALAHGNKAAAERLLERGGELTLAVAVGLQRLEDARKLAPSADEAERLLALTVAAFYGDPSMITFLLSIGTNPNGYPKNRQGFHAHATPLHQAVYSRSLESVKLLVSAGASLGATDKIYEGTALDWAEYMPTEAGYDDSAKAGFAQIAEYLRGQQQ